MNKCFIFVTFLLGFYKPACSSTEFYSAVVIEYSPPLDATIDGLTNLLNNVNTYVEIINNAKSQLLADIIVFPEVGLQGAGNQRYYVEVPNPTDRITLCASNTTYEVPLVQLSCAARAAQAYVVVNLGEKFYNTTQQRTVYFNTNVVFDVNGTVVARYRKIHLFGEANKEPSANRELVYFDTEFGVRFGIFTCFDIVFEVPGVVLANEFNITHFIFLSGWMSQLPFLTAIQQQHYWAYTQDVVLLAAGYNLPSRGSSGTGVYLGRHGPLTYRMVESSQSFMLQAHVPKNYSSSGGIHQEVRKSTSENEKIIGIEDSSSNNLVMNQNVISSQEKIKLKKEDFLNIYASKLITIPDTYFDYTTKNTGIVVPVIVKEEICQNNLCCQFSINISVIFYNYKTRENVTRGDDYSQMFYRLAVFDGVRHYDHIATGGLQTCAIISCINQDISSCGLRSDEPSAQPNMIKNFWQSDFIFDSITITGNFSTNHLFIGPNVLLGGEGENYGSLLPSNSFVFTEISSNVSAGTVLKSFQTIARIPRLVTASLYGRLFLRDGLPSSDQAVKQSSSKFDVVNFTLLLIAVILIKYSQ